MGRPDFSFLFLLLFLAVLPCLYVEGQGFSYPGIKPDQCKNGAQWYLKGACQCTAGFGSDDCGAFDCNHGVYNSSTNTCVCNQGWTGVLCTVCQTDDVCRALPGASNQSYCDSSLKVIKKKSFSCQDHDRIIDAILSGTKAFVVAELDKNNDKNSSFTFSFLRDQKPDGTAMADLFSCSISGCEEFYDAEAIENHLVYNCTNVTCAMACELGSPDCSPILEQVVKKVSGATSLHCSKAGECTVNEMVLDKLFRGGVHINCTAGECVDGIQPTPTVLPPKPRPKPSDDDSKKQVEKTLFILYILVGLLAVFIILGLITYAAVVARNRTHGKQFSLQYDESSVTKYLRGLGQFHGSLAWFDLCYDIDIRTGFRKPKERKSCLRNVTGVAHPGEVIAVMGPSGSGKSTFLDILSGREKRGRMSGDVLVDGRPRGPHFKRMSGFVDQEDCLIGTLTVQESLMYSALLRLPDSVPADVKKKRVQTVMDSLKISSIANSTIGTSVSRGISGGEKRRVSIAMELVPCPSVLFLDEPTSGLDSSNAYIIVDCLARLASEDETIIIMSIHQPRSKLFQLFDKLLLLSKGEMIYFGPADQSLSHFTKAGFDCPGSYNPADFLIDTIVDCEAAKQTKGLRRSVELSLIDTTRNQMQPLVGNSLDDEDDVAMLGDDTEDLVLAYLHSGFAQDYREEIEGIVAQAHDSPHDAEREMKKAAKNMTASWFMQFAILSHRTLNNLVRNPYLIFGHMLTSAVIGVILGLIYWHTGDKYDAQMAQAAKEAGDTHNNIINKFINRMASLLLMCAFLAFGSLTSLEMFYSERIIYMHERANGFYFPSTYYLQKVLFDIIPLRILPPMVMGTIAYFMIGLREGTAYFLGFIAILVLVNLCASAICMLIGLVTSRPATGNLVASLVILLSLMLTPIFNNKDSMPPWLSWIHYLSFFYYGYEALAVNELDGQYLSGNVYGDIDAADIDSTEILRKLGLCPENYVMDVTVLFVVSILMLIAGYFVLKFHVRQMR